MKPEITLNKHTCATHGCGIAYWLEEGFEERRRADKGSFYCPNGHSHYYAGETDAQKLTRITRQKDATIAELERKLKARAARRKKKETV